MQSALQLQMSEGGCLHVPRQQQCSAVQRSAAYTLHVSAFLIDTLELGHDEGNGRKRWLAVSRTVYHLVYLLKQHITYC